MGSWIEVVVRCSRERSELVIEMKIDTKFICVIMLLVTAELVSTDGRQEGYGGRIRQNIQQRPRVRGNGRPVGQYGGRPQQAQAGGGGGGFGDLLEGVELNLLDAKLIGLGYVREDLVQELCARATQALIREGVQRAQSEAQTQIQNLTATVDARCADLVNEADSACSQVIGQITDRFNTLTEEVILEGEKQCDNTKQLTVEMVKKGAQSSYDMQLELGRQVAENEFQKKVEQQKNRGERMFKEEVEKHRGIAEEELRRRIEEGRQFAERNFTQELENGKLEAERQYQETIDTERAKAEVEFQARVAEEREKAEKVFDDRVAEGRAEAEKQFKDASLKGQEEGEKMCTEMITVACQNVTLGSESDDFCEEFFFFTTELDDDELGRRLKRQDHHLYGSFYQSISG